MAQSRAVAVRPLVPAGIAFVMQDDPTHLASIVQYRGMDARGSLAFGARDEILFWCDVRHAITYIPRGGPGNRKPTTPACDATDGASHGTAGTLDAARERRRKRTIRRLSPLGWR
jgi:hypothetical protein